jgi:hypothetical protein
MKNYVLHKTESTPDDVILFFSTIIVIILTVKTELYLAYTPILVLLSIGLFGKMILYFKWQCSYAIKLTSDHIILNHTLLHNKITIPLSSISCINREKRYIELNEGCNIKVSGFGKRKNARISFSSLSDSERNEIFDRMEDFGLVSV